jgi:hypothetical protein
VALWARRGYVRRLIGRLCVFRAHHLTEERVVMSDGAGKRRLVAHEDVPRVEVLAAQDERSPGKFWREH